MQPRIRAAGSWRRGPSIPAQHVTPSSPWRAGCLAAALAIGACSDDGTAAAQSSGSSGEGPGTTAPSTTATATDPSASGSGNEESASASGPGTGADSTGDPPEPDQPLSPFIVVDQFGWRPGAEKIAVVRSPVTGFDAGTAFSPGSNWAVIDANAQQSVLTLELVPWQGGAEDPSSGDVAWRLDLSSLDTPGDYYVLDVDNQVRSDVFRIADDVYRDVLRAAVRMLFYQRDGFAKDARHAGAPWADDAAHVGPGQGPECEAQGGGSPRDLQGGWWDAGDQNKYTNWSASYAITLLRAYRERPAAFTDDYGIPESGNGVPDVIDENHWNLAWLVRMQGGDGSVLSIVGQDGAPDPAFGGSPDTSPSSATGPCTYGPANTSATLSAAGTFALAALVYRDDAIAAVYPGYADELTARAEQAWDWAAANPGVTFYNSGSIGAGEQEVDDHGRLIKRLSAAVYLFELTGDPQYRAAFDADYDQTQLMGSGYLDVFAMEEHDSLLAYTQVDGATAAVVDDILAAYAGGLEGDNNLGTLTADPDPYLAQLYVYVWGSNQVRADQGNLLWNAVGYGAGGGATADAARAAERYVHALHGLNPLSLVYLSNMDELGASTSVTTIYHSWFAHGSDWDAEGESQYGPPPGYLVGGPNPSYDWDGCCPDGCSGFDCGAAPLSPPFGQPPQKSYAEFNDGWPLDSWSVTEPSNGYQVKYIRLLSKFVD